MVDASRVSTFVISILLIVYGSFRSLNIEQENREKEKEKEHNEFATSQASSDADQGGMIDSCLVRSIVSSLQS